MRTLLPFICLSLFSLHAGAFEAHSQLCYTRRMDILEKLVLESQETDEVYFFDTQKLQIAETDTIFRLRKDEKGEGLLTFKWRSTEKKGEGEMSGQDCEPDLYGDTLEASCKWESTLSKDQVGQLIQNPNLLEKMLSKAQLVKVKELLKKDLSTLKLRNFGPVTMHRWTIDKAPDLGRKWRLEIWDYDPVTFITEVSYRFDGEVSEAKKITEDFVKDHRLNECEKTTSKTQFTLQYFLKREQSPAVHSIFP